MFSMLSRYSMAHLLFFYLSIIYKIIMYFVPFIFNFDMIISYINITSHVIIDYDYFVYWYLLKSCLFHSRSYKSCFVSVFESTVMIVFQSVFSLGNISK